MFENGADDRRVLDAADDPHGALTLRTDQGIDFVDFLNQSRPVPPEGLFISLRFEDTGDGIVIAFLLPFPPGDVAVVSLITHHVDHLCGDLSPGKEHFEHLVPEDALQLFQFKRRGDAEHAPAAVETAIRHEDVAVRIESQKIAEGLNGDDGTGDGIIFGNCLLEKYLQGFPSAAAQIGKKFTVVKEVSA